MKARPSQAKALGSHPRLLSRVIPSDSLPVPGLSSLLYNGAVMASAQSTVAWAQGERSGVPAGSASEPSAAPLWASCVVALSL